VLRILTALGAAVGVLTIGVVAAAPAQATATKCVRSHVSTTVAAQTCLYVKGQSLWVERTTTRHLHSGDGAAQLICNYKATNWGIVEHGSKWSWTSAPVSGCATLIAPIDIRIMESFMSNSDFCGQFYHSGAWQAGQPCVRILRG
jgi:hypothetical protein